jgi:hypothetical protein
LGKERVKAVAAIIFCVAWAFAGLVKPGFLAETVSAKPAFMDRYNRDPYSVAKLRGHCTICHLGRGGGERNDFGEAFGDAGFRITPHLREKFPKMFENRKGSGVSGRSE